MEIAFIGSSHTRLALGRGPTHQKQQTGSVTSGGSDIAAALSQNAHRNNYAGSFNGANYHLVNPGGDVGTLKAKTTADMCFTCWPAEGSVASGRSNLDV